MYVRHTGVIFTVRRYSISVCGTLRCRLFDYFLWTL